MANVSTSGFWGGLASLGSSIGSGIASVGSSITGLVQGLAPLIGPGIGLASQFLGQQRSQIVAAPGYGGGGMPNYTTGVMPGGALVPYNQAGLFGGPGLSGPLFGGADVPSTTGGAVLSGPARLPRTVQATDARGRPRVYVLAPSITPRYRVTMRTTRRRSCARRHAGGR